MLQKISRGDVYYYNFGQVFKGSMEGKRRPCVVISNDLGNTYGTTALVAPITSRDKSSCKSWQVHFTNENRSQIILLEQIRVVNISDLEDFIGRLDATTMKAVDVALAIELDLNTTDRELDEVEFLNRLDNSLSRIIKEHIGAYDSKFSRFMTLITNSLSEYKTECNKLFEKLSKNMQNTDAGLDEIKNLFNKNSDNLDKILSSLINIYKNIDTNALNTMSINTDSVENKKKTKTEAKTKKSKYTLDYAKEFITNYYNMDRQSFMDKYELFDTITINNRLTTMKNILKKNGLDYKNIKYNIKVYNMSDLSEEEKRTKFSKYLKENETLAVTDTLNKPSHEPEEYGLNDTSNYKGGNGQNKGSKQSVRAERFEYTIENCLAFVDECNKNSIEEMCKTYDLTNKQFSNRKYLICKWLKEQGVSFKVVKYTRV